MLILAAELGLIYGALRLLPQEILGFLPAEIRPGKAFSIVFMRFMGSAGPSCSWAERKSAPSSRLEA